MRFFIRSRKFKIMVAIFACVLVLAIGTKIAGGMVAPGTGIVGAVTTPVQKFFKSTSNSVSDFFTKLNKSDKLMLDNSSLNEKINRLTSDLMGYEQAKQQNEFYKNYLGIKDLNPSFEFEPAMLISHNSDDPYGSFLIDKGSLNGISVYDPVITSAGLIGYISEVAPSYSKVATILDPNVTCGSFDRRTNDVGIVSGELELAKSGKTHIKNLARTSGVAVGDYIVTSGGGVFPEGLIIGTIDSLHKETYNNSVYGVITPTVKFAELREMMVITDFSGQGDISKSGDSSK